MKTKEKFLVKRVLKEKNGFNILCQNKYLARQIKFAKSQLKGKEPKVGDTIEFEAAACDVLIKLSLNDEVLYQRPQEDIAKISQKAFSSYSTYVITNIYQGEDGYDISTDQGICLFVKAQYLNGQKICIGDDIGLFCKNCSYIVGIDINSELLYLTSKEEQEQQRIAWLEQMEIEKKEAFAKNKDQMDKNFDALPKLLQHRLLMYRMFDEKFRQDEEGYEEISIRLGWMIFKLFHSEEEIVEFHNKEYSEQIKIIPEIDTEGVSGNVLGFACFFAKGLIHDVLKMDFDNPSKKNLQEAYAMLLPNALAPISGHRCFPRQKYIKEYVKTI